MVNEDTIKPEDRELLLDNSSKYADMQRDDLEMEIYHNLMESESNNSRKYLSMIQPFENKEITDLNIN
jgi:hypothetical protein